MAMRPVRSAVAALALAALLSGCVSMPSPEIAPGTRPARASISAYSLSGRISAQKGADRYVANIAWQHGEARDEILLSSMFGQGIAQLGRDGNGARLVTADRQEFTGADWEELSARVFGFVLPLSKLPAWIVAQAPSTAARDETGRPRHFIADGWSVDYLDYENAGGDALPQLIEIKRDNLALRLKIDQWQEVR